MVGGEWIFIFMFVEINNFIALTKRDRLYGCYKPCILNKGEPCTPFHP